jgi:tRNA1(Val) A37 N6-methylase TrmN6
MWRSEIPDGPGAVDPSTAGMGETLDRLAGAWWIYQLERGQRYSTDDVVTAWCAIRARPDARRVLDLGAGTGAVGLMTLLRLHPEATVVSVEKQPQSAGLLERTVALNRIRDRVEVRRGDLRDPALLADRQPFDLIVTNPPYLPRGAALASPYPERAAARMELSGDVFDFTRVAEGLLAADGALCVCHAASDQRPEKAGDKVGLALRERVRVIARQGKRPLIAVRRFERARGECSERTVVVRDASGARTDGFRELRRQMLIEE